MSAKLDPQALDQLFLTARTANGFLDQPVSKDLLKQAYELARMAPTAMNSQPARYVFITTPEAKARLLPLMSAGNVDKTRAAPVTVLVATDSKFYEHMPQIWHGAGAKEMIEGNPAMAGKMAGLNGVLGGAYFILAARAVGLDCGPMAGFDAAKVNAEFFPDGRYSVNFVLNLGHADHSKEFARNGRLSFEQACTVL